MNANMRFVPAIILLIGLLTGCQSIQMKPPVSCGEIYDATILKYPFDGGLSVEQTADWVKANFTVSTVATNSHTDGSDTIRWVVSGREYDIRLDSHGSTASVFWSATKPSIADVVRCFGAPTAYRAMWLTQPDGIHTNVDFWYASSGVIIGASLKGKKTTINEADEMTSAGFTKPATLMDMHRRLTLIGNPVERDFSLLKPWPGSVTGIVVVDAANH